MKKIFHSFIVLSCGILLSIVIASGSAHAAVVGKEFDYGYFGVNQENTKTKVLWAEYPYNRHTYETVTMDGDGIIVFRVFSKNGSMLSQNVLNVNGIDTITFDKKSAYGISMQLLEGDEVKFTNAETTNPLSAIVNFFDYDF